MNKIAIYLLLSVILALLLELIAPWWGVVLATAFSSFIVRLKGVSSVLVPFLSMGVLWGVEAYLLGAANDFILTQKIAVLFSLGNSIWGPIALTSVVGGVFGVVGSLTGRSLKVLVS